MRAWAGTARPAVLERRRALSKYNTCSLLLLTWLGIFGHFQSSKLLRRTTVYQYDMRFRIYHTSSRTAALTSELSSQAEVAQLSLCNAITEKPDTFRRRWLQPYFFCRDRHFGEDATRPTVQQLCLLRVVNLLIDPLALHNGRRLCFIRTVYSLRYRKANLPCSNYHQVCAILAGTLSLPVRINSPEPSSASSIAQAPFFSSSSPRLSEPPSAQTLPSLRIRTFGPTITRPRTYGLLLSSV